MFDQLKNSTKSGALKFIQAITVVGTTLLITLSVNANPSSKAVQKEIAEIFKKNPDKQIVVKVENQSTNEETAIEMLGGNDTINALDFAVQNVDKYYPDMKEHLDNLLESFRDQEQKDTVNFLFQEHIFKNITDPQKQVASIIYCIENFVFKGNEKITKKFGTNYKIGTIIEKEEYKYLFDFDKGYNKRFKGYYMKLEKTIITMKQQNEQMKQQNEQMKQQNEQMKQELKKIEEKIKKLDEENEKLKKETEGIINTFTVNDVKTNIQVKKLILDVEELYIFAEYEIYPHLAELIKAAKQ